MERLAGGTHLRGAVAYLVAVLLVAACAVVRWTLDPLLESQGPYLAFMIPVAVSAYVGGTGPCALSIVLSSIVAGPLFQQPSTTDRTAVAHLLLFTCEAVALLELFRRLGRRDDELRAAVRAADAARKSAEAANAAKEQFVARVSHEWRSPLNSISGWLAILEHRPGDAALVSRAVASMKRSVAMQTRLVSDLLDVSRGGSGKLSVTRQPVALDEVLMRAIEAVQTDAARKGVRVEATPQPVQVVGDPVRLEQIFLNLLNNAVKFTPSGGQVAAAIMTSAGSVEVSISDTGVGIRREALATIFDPFVQVDEGRDTRRGGLGLGLAIVRTLVQLHGGSVWATSAGEGRGTTFHLRMPVEPAHTARPPDAAAAGNPPAC